MMAMLTATVCACSMWLNVQVSAFVKVPGVSISHQQRPAAKRQELLRLHGGGLQGRPSKAEGPSTDDATPQYREHQDGADDNSGNQGRGWES